MFTVNIPQKLNTGGVMSKIIVVLCIIMLCGIAFGQWERDVRLTNQSATSSGAYNNANKVAVSGNIVHVVWHDERAGNEIYYTRSTDGGTTWPASPAGDIRLTNATGTSNYAAVAAMGDTVHVVWEDIRDGNYEIYYTRSIDGGVTWPVSPGGDVRLTNATGASEYPAIAVTGDTVHVIWQDAREDASSEIYYKRSVDGGTTWSSDTRLTTSVGFASWWPSIAVSGNNVHVVWRDNRDANIEIYYKRSIDGGTNWSSDIRLTTNTAESWNPSVAVSGDTVHVVWSDSHISGSNFEIYYNRSINNGTSWGADTRLTNATGASHFPSVAVEGSNVHVVWQDPRPGVSNDIFYIHSADNGTTWGSDTNLTNVSGTQKYLPGVVAAGGNVHVVWRDLRDGSSGEMYYKRYVGTVYYTITATAFGGGTITPSGLIVVPGGTDTTFTITANPGHNLDSVVVDGANQGVITSYTFYNVSANHTIKAYFSPVSFIMSENTTTLKFNFNVMPNPFRNLTTIRYTVPLSGKVSLKLYNATGRLIEILNNSYLNTGNYTTTLSNIAKGVYFLKYEDATSKSEVKLIVQ